MSGSVAFVINFSRPDYYPVAKVKYLDEQINPTTTTSSLEFYQTIKLRGYIQFLENFHIRCVDFYLSSKRF